MSTPNNGPIVVGMDSSPRAMEAAEFAAAEARTQRLPLLVVHCFMWPTFYPPLLEPDPGDPGPHVRARSLLDHATEELRGKYPDINITSRLRNGPPAAMLTDQSNRAAMLVVGHRGTGGFHELHVGSVAIHTAAHAHCPVAVVRGWPAPPNGPVVVGLDGSVESERARAFAFAAAHRRGVPLRVVAVWPPHAGLPSHIEAAAREATPQIIVDDLGDLPADYPDVVVEARLLRDHSVAGALITESLDAGLIVVGSKGIGGLRDILLGSVGRALIAHARCPVVVVRGQR